MKAPSITKKRIAGLRNWNKGRLQGAFITFENVQNGPITQTEKEILNRVLKELSAIWRIWDENSKKAINDFCKQKI